MKRFATLAVALIFALPAAADELADLRAENAALRAEVDDLKDQVDALKAKQPQRKAKHFRSIAQLWNTMPPALRRGPWTPQRLNVASAALASAATGHTLTVRGKLEKVTFAPGRKEMTVTLLVQRARIIATCPIAQPAEWTANWNPGTVLTAEGPVKTAQVGTDGRNPLVVVILSDASVR